MSVISPVYLRNETIIFTFQQQSWGLTQHLTKLALIKLMSLKSYQCVFVRVHACLCVHAFNMTICAG